MGALGDIAGSFITSGLDALISGRQASKNREFQSQMSSTAHQREVHDLKLAGLNPILSAGGRGASSPSGNMAAGSSLGQAYGNASSRSILREAMKAQVANTKAITASNAIDAKYKEDAYKVYLKSPLVRGAVTGGKLGMEAGVKGPVGAVLGTETSALQGFKDAQLLEDYKRRGNRKRKASRKSVNEAYESYQNRKIPNLKNEPAIQPKNWRAPIIAR